MLALLLGGRGKSYFVIVWVGLPPLSTFFQNKSAFSRVWSKKTELFSCYMQIWCSILIDFFSCFYFYFFLPTAVKWTILVNSLDVCANCKRKFVKNLVYNYKIFFLVFNTKHWTVLQTISIVFLEICNICFCFKKYLAWAFYCCQMS